MKSNLKRTLTLVLFPLTLSSIAFAQTSREGPIIGHSEGNHRLDCTVIRPWEGEGGPADPSDGPFAVIGSASANAIVVNSFEDL